MTGVRVSTVIGQPSVDAKNEQMKIREIETWQSIELTNHLQTLEIKSNVELSFEAHLLELLDMTLTAQEIIQTLHPNGNKIDYAEEVDFIELQENIERVVLDYYHTELRNQLRKISSNQMWQLIEAIFPSGIQKIVQLGSHVPYVNILGGVTALIFSLGQPQCLLLIVNTSD